MGGPTSSSSSTSSSRCTQCNLSSKGTGRNLVVCIDGTSNQFGQKNTNVVKLFAEVDIETDKPKQCAYYSSGIGTSPKSLRIVDRVERAITDKFGMAIAWNMEEIVEDAYGWLARTYQEGDQIYLFGFSRGAYQVRVLAGMIREVGLIRTPTDKQIRAAYDHYESIRSRKPDTKQIAREFKNTFSWKGLGVHFVGVWDTVSSVGLIRGDVFLSTSSSASHACHFRHALALDELRVKFMPEYFHEVNQQTEDVKSRYIIPPDGRNGRTSTGSDDGTHPSEDKRITEIKEVWFAGSHSDVGGKNRPGKPHQAGNASLLWMRQEAVASGLVLKPTDIVWVPDDLDFGINDSMNPGWAVVEYMPVKQQVSFSGTGKDKRRFHRSQPRRIIPGQKVHASVLYANAYRPLATPGEGFNIPIVHSEPEELDSRFWETRLFDDSAAQELVARLDRPEEVSPIYIDRLLFLLRFEEGKQCLRRVPGWQSQFMRLIQDSQCDRLVRLVTIVAYYEASHNAEAHPKSPVRVDDGDFPRDALDIAKECLNEILAELKPQEGPRVVALLRPLTRHRSLREHILTKVTLRQLGTLLDNIFAEPKENFGLTMDALNSLLQCDDSETREICAQKLQENPPASQASRLSLILGVDGPHLLTAALRMASTLARIPEGKSISAMWVEVKPRIRKLASQEEGLTGLLAIEILLALYDPTDQGNLNIHNTHVRANLARALFHLNTDRYEPADGQDRNSAPGRQVFRDIFGMDATELNLQQRELLGELKATVKRGNIRERTAATMTLMNLWDTAAIRAYLCDDGINLLDVFVGQLRHKGSALLAAYALATCLKHNETKEYVKNNNDLPRCIIYMLRWDYFDDAFGPIEGFQIFGDLMQNADLREKVMSCNITGLLGEKLKNGDPNETRTSLICLQIFRFFDEEGPWTKQLVDKSLKLLQSSEWKSQKAGVTIIYALSQTKHGVETIEKRVHEIVRILVPTCYLPIQPTPLHVTPESTNSQTQRSAVTTDVVPPCMMGPACVLRVLAQNETLRNHTRNTREYIALKDLHLSGRLVGKANTSPLYVWTPNRDDVINMIEKMIKAVDGELFEDGLMSIGDTVLPHIQHWDRLGMILQDKTVKLASVLPLLCASILVVLTLVATAPIYASVQAYGFLRRLWSRNLDNRFLRNDILSGLCTHLSTRQVESAPAGAEEDDGGPSGEHGESSRRVETAHTGSQLTQTRSH